VWRQIQLITPSRAYHYATNGRATPLSVRSPRHDDNRCSTDHHDIEQNIINVENTTSALSLSVADSDFRNPLEGVQNSTKISASNYTRFSENPLNFFFKIKYIFHLILFSLTVCHYYFLDSPVLCNIWKIKCTYSDIGLGFWLVALPIYHVFI